MNRKKFNGETRGRSRKRERVSARRQLSSRGADLFNLLADGSPGQTPWLHRLAGLETLIKEEMGHWSLQ